MTERCQVSIMMLPKCLLPQKELADWQKNYRVNVCGGTLEVQLYHRLFSVIRVADGVDWGTESPNFPWCSFKSVAEAWRSAKNRIMGGNSLEVALD